MPDSDDLFDEPKSDIVYFWFIAFRWHILEENPFVIFVRESFGDDDIPESWFTGVLTDEDRKIKLKLKPVSGDDPWSIFCKVEKGKKSNFL